MAQNTQRQHWTLTTRNSPTTAGSDLPTFHSSILDVQKCMYLSFLIRGFHWGPKFLLVIQHYYFTFGIFRPPLLGELTLLIYMLSPVTTFIGDVILKTESSLCTSLRTVAQVKNSPCYFTYLLAQQRTQRELGVLDCLNRLTYLQFQSIHTWKVFRSSKNDHVTLSPPEPSAATMVAKLIPYESSLTRESMLSVIVFSSLRFSTSSDQNNFFASNASTDWFTIKYLNSFPEILITCYTALTGPDFCLSQYITVS